MTYLFFILSACFGALTQLIIFEQHSQSWLPEWVLRWDSGILATLDAFHVYQGLQLILFGIAFLRMGRVITENSSATVLRLNDFLRKFYLRGDRIFGKSWRWVSVVLIIVVYYQLYNLFYHIVFRFPEYWRWPIFSL